MAKKSQFKNWFPKIDSIVVARQVGRQGVWAACFAAGVTFVVAAAAAMNWLPPELSTIFSAWSFVDVAISLLIAWGIHHMFRSAAIAGLTLHIISRITLMLSGAIPNAAGTVLAIAVAVAFINSIRGTFAYHRFIQQERHKPVS